MLQVALGGVDERLNGFCIYQRQRVFLFLSIVIIVVLVQVVPCSRDSVTSSSVLYAFIYTSTCKLSGKVRFEWLEK
jgi:hypothetical protein